MGTADRRGKKRVPAEYKVDCIHTGDFIISQTRDISADGMFICTENPPAVGQKVILKFSVDGLEDLELAGRVAWVNTTGDRRHHGMGIKFIKPKVSMQREILNAVNKVAVLEGVA
ncbi:MAG: hypothetical protein AUK28_01895 [Desulfobacterales bacterium CG2_30_60_27]|nr:MAG: hypothetical protein AUK28_01895 [Desulfobacterales bacterium CG2_30_60_27]